MSSNRFTCAQCGQILTDPPLCYAVEAPWRLVGVPESELENRVLLSEDMCVVDLSEDMCVVDAKYFFVRGQIAIPILDRPATFLWSVWCSLSENSFRDVFERWDEPARPDDPPYFGWLMSILPGYPETLHMQARVQSRGVGVVPLVTVVEPAGHPLVREQQEGITMERVHEFAHLVLHGG